MKHIHPTRCLAISFLTLLLLATGSASAGLPRQDDPFVNDFAQLLSASESQRLTTTLRNFEQRSDVRMTVVTVESFGQYGTGDRSIESFATRLFNDWGIGNAQRNDGVLILVAKADRKMRIEVGRSYDSSWDGRTTSIIDQKMLPEFKRGDFPKGIERGAEAMIQAIEKQTPQLATRNETTPRQVGTQVDTRVQGQDQGQAEQPLIDASMTAGEAESTVQPLRSHSARPATPTETATAAETQTTRRESKQPPLLAVIGSAIAALAAIIASAFGLGRLLRRKCPLCRAVMNATKDSASILPHLSDTQEFELKLGSMKFRLWQCSRCEHQEIDGSSRWFSGFSNCSSCSVRAERKSRQTLTQSTRWTHGEELISHHCEHCGAHHETTQTLPLLPAPSDSSSGSSFGSGGSSSSSNNNSGGSSRGGGGSGSW